MTARAMPKAPAREPPFQSFSNGQTWLRISKKGAPVQSLSLADAAAIERAKAGA